MSERDDLRATIDAAHTRFLAAIDDFPEKVLETEPALGAWSPRDVTGHVADWEQEMLLAARHILGEKKPTWHPIKDGQAYNTTQAALRGIDSWSAVRADFEEARVQMLAFVDGLSDEQLTAIGPYPWGEIGPIERLLIDLVAHLDEHAAELESWRLQRTGARMERGKPRD